MFERELLSMAAKAAGYAIHSNDERAPGAYVSINGRVTHWNPLADDGDAFRLAVALWLEIRVFNGKAHAGRQDRFWCTEECGDDPSAAARRAVVRAAARLAAQAAAKGAA
jgi:hypothetical protein